MAHTERAAVVIGVVLALLTTVGLVSVRGVERPAVDAVQARTAIERSLEFIEREGLAWMEGRVPIQHGNSCVSCHHVGFAVWGLREARRQGIERAGTRIEELRDRAARSLMPGACEAASCAPLVLAWADAGAAAAAELHALAVQLTGKQAADGHWPAQGQFPTQRRPIEESDAVMTMWTVLALDSLGVAEESIGESRAAAERWVRARPRGESTEWLVTRLLVEHRSGEGAASGSVARQLVARQNPDGGWPWRPGQASDAMSTGQAVYALALVGGEVAREPVHRAVGWLLSAQEADGTWVTASELVSSRPSTGKDYVYTYWGTAWAAIGLARALDGLPQAREAAARLEPRRATRGGPRPPGPVSSG